MANLLPGESIILRRHRHWIVPARSLFWPILLVVVVGVLDHYLKESLVARDVKTVATLGALAVLGLWAIVTWLRWNATSVTITDQRVMLDRGVLSRSSKVVPIDRVQDVSTRQSILGRILGYGTVEIDAAGSQGAELLDHVPDPNHFRDEVFVQSERLRRPAGQSLPSPTTAV
jgi:uncharacterized membrane protein YdbT with pleckstrin-like domain